MNWFHPVSNLLIYDVSSLAVPVRQMGVTVLNGASKFSPIILGPGPDGICGSSHPHSAATLPLNTPTDSYLCRESQFVILGGGGVRWFYLNLSILEPGGKLWCCECRSHFSLIFHVFLICDEETFHQTLRGSVNLSFSTDPALIGHSWCV